MRLRHPLRQMTITATAVVAAAVLGAPLAQAAPASPAVPSPPVGTTVAGASPFGTPSTPPKVDQRVLSSVGAFVPAIIGAAATPGADGKINTALLEQARALAATGQFPPELKAIWDQVISFLDGSAKPAAATRAAGGAPEIPTGPNAPKIQQFLYPTVGFGCIPGGNSVGTALVTAGPQDAPAPGPRAGQAGYVYTALGTGPAFNSKTHPLVAAWINIDTQRTGQINLLRNSKINAAKGPGTFTAIANTGRGRVISAIYGNVTTTIKGKVVGCTIIPTVGLAFV